MTALSLLKSHCIVESSESLHVPLVQVKYPFNTEISKAVDTAKPQGNESPLLARRKVEVNIEDLRLVL